MCNRPRQRPPETGVFTTPGTWSERRVFAGSANGVAEGGKRSVVEGCVEGWPGGRMEGMRVGGEVN